MAKPGWRFIARRLNGDGTETTLDFNVPITDETITDVLSGPPGLSGALSMRYPQLIASDGQPLLREWSTALYAEEEGVIRGGGIVTKIRPTGDTLRVDCAGWTAYPQGMPYSGSTFFVDKDPLDIVRHIWAHLQGQQDGNLGVVIDDTTSPVRIGQELEQVQFDTQSGPVSFEAGPYKLEWFSTADLGKNIDDLAGDTPFDYHEEMAWNGEEISHFVRIGYPSLGARRPGLRFVVGENVTLIPEQNSNSETYANGALVLGRGEGRVMKHGLIYVPDGSIRRIAVVEDKSLNTDAGCISAARTEVGRRKHAFTVSQITVADHPHARPGSYNVGDEIRLQSKNGWAPMDIWVRVLSISRSPSRSSDSLLTVMRTDIVSA